MAAGSPEQPQRSMNAIELTEKEERIFGRLLEVVRYFGLSTQLRVAGGWVRDKLLGEAPVDIDIAVDNMTGLDFCMKVNELIGEETKGIHIVRSNPDQSKHLETARIKVFDTWVDFVNLRSEKYAFNSRIPTVEIGTAEVDAYRRDLTINSLFFNINNNSVEDFTGRGIDDLKKGLIATPLPAKSTFLDDPLRVLRAIRFAARFNFTLSEDLKNAASDEEVKRELGSKISRQRVGKEVDLMMSGKHPDQAMSYIRELGLFYVVFAFHEKCNPPVFYRYDWCCVSHIEAAWEVICSVASSVSYPILLDEQVYLYSALLIPLHNMFCFDRKSKIPIASYIIQDALKLSTSVAKSVNSIHTASRKFAELVLLFESNDALGHLKEELEDEYLSIPTDVLKRVYAGLILDEVKGLWRVALLISILFYPEAISFGETLSEDELHQRKVKFIQMAHWRKVKYIQIESSITNRDLDWVWKCKRKPLLTGEDITRVMQVKEGPLIGEWTKRVFKWQLAHPGATMDDCMEWLKQSQSKRQKVTSAPDTGTPWMIAIEAVALLTLAFWAVATICTLPGD